MECAVVGYMRAPRIADQYANRDDIEQGCEFLDLGAQLGGQPL
jgi:hypothetical protein